MMEAHAKYVPIAELRRALPWGMALCRRCVSVGIPGDRYLCNGCTQALNPPERVRADKEQAMLRQVVRRLMALLEERQDAPPHRP